MTCPFPGLPAHLFSGSVLSGFGSRLEPAIPQRDRPVLEPLVKVSERLSLHLFGLQGHAYVRLEELIHHQARERVRGHPQVRGARLEPRLEVIGRREVNVELSHGLESASVVERCQ